MFGEVAKLSIVGAGPGSPEYVTPASRKTVQAAQIVVGAKRNLDLFKDDIAGEVVVLTGKNVADSLKYAVESAQNGKPVAIVSTGDPGFSGLLGSVLSRINDASVDLEVIPGVSSIQACAALLCMRWDNVEMLTFHDGASTEKKNALTKAVNAGRTVILLPDPRAFTPKEIATYLINSGTDKATPMAVCENLTMQKERLIQTTLQEALELDFASLCVMVINAPKTID